MQYIILIIIFWLLSKLIRRKIKKVFAKLNSRVIDEKKDFES